MFRGQIIVRKDEDDINNTNLKTRALLSGGSIQIFPTAEQAQWWIEHGIAKSNQNDFEVVGVVVTAEV